MKQYIKIVIIGKKSYLCYAIQKKIAHLAEIPTLIYGVVSSPAFVTVGLENTNKIAKKSLDKKAIPFILSQTIAQSLSPTIPTYRC